MRVLILTLSLSFGLVLALGSIVSAQTIVSRGQSFVTARILPGSLTETGTRLAGLELTLAPGWKTYWRSPGPMGIPPKFTWAGSGNLASTKVFWPTPGIFKSYGMTTIGYADRVVLPFEITPDDPSAPIDLALGVELGVCRDICVFEQVQLTADLPPSLASGERPIARALARRPYPGGQAGLKAATCRIEGGGKSRRLLADLAFDREVSGAKVLLEGPKDVWFHKTKTQEGAGTLTVSAEIDMLSDQAWLSRGAIRMTVLAPGWAADIQGCEAPKG